MFQALLHKKLKDSFFDQTFFPSEDSLTSSVIGILQYLPSTYFWALIRRSCGNQSNLPYDIGELISIKFWHRFKGKNCFNVNFVEPDVFCEFENYDVIIEAKKGDSFGQYTNQWEKEITSYINEQESKKQLIFIALGGNDSLRDTMFCINNKNYIIHTGSWYRLLDEVEKLKFEIKQSTNPTQNVVRVLEDTIKGFNKHNYFCMDWLTSLSRENIYNKSIGTIFDWDFDNKPIMQNFNIFSGIKLKHQIFLK